MMTALKSISTVILLACFVSGCTTPQDTDSPPGPPTPFGTFSAVTTDLGDGLYTISTGGYRT
ncbi:MAG: hypothetical protein RJS98_16150, partial [Rhodospirillaceae bacterium]